MPSHVSHKIFGKNLSIKIVNNKKFHAFGHLFKKQWTIEKGLDFLVLAKNTEKRMKFKDPNIGQRSSF